MGKSHLVTGHRPGCGILITGGPGTGKSWLAVQLANFICPPDWRVLVADRRMLKSKFLFASRPAVIIAEESPDLRDLNALVCSDTVLCEQKGKDPFEMPTPRVIATSQFPAPPDSRRWIVISLGGELCPTTPA